MINATLKQALGGTARGVAWRLVVVGLVAMAAGCGGQGVQREVGGTGADEPSCEKVTASAEAEGAQTEPGGGTAEWGTSGEEGGDRVTVEERKGGCEKAGADTRGSEPSTRPVTEWLRPDGEGKAAVSVLYNHETLESAGKEEGTGESVRVIYAQDPPQAALVLQVQGQTLAHFVRQTDGDRVMCGHGDDGSWRCQRLDDTRSAQAAVGAGLWTIGRFSPVLNRGWESLPLARAYRRTTTTIAGRPARCAAVDDSGHRMQVCADREFGVLLRSVVESPDSNMQNEAVRNEAIDVVTPPDPSLFEKPAAPNQGP